MITKSKKELEDRNATLLRRLSTRESDERRELTFKCENRFETTNEVQQGVLINDNMQWDQIDGRIELPSDIKITVKDKYVPHSHAFSRITSNIIKKKQRSVRRSYCRHSVIVKCPSRSQNIVRRICKQLTNLHHDTSTLQNEAACILAICNILSKFKDILRQLENRASSMSDFEANNLMTPICELISMTNDDKQGTKMSAKIIAEKNLIEINFADGLETGYVSNYDDYKSWITVYPL
ncbi:hypothetical protein A3Q56_03535 [Intoshia linei]|uniref:Uncharacterized protein n=1 Tax=Intoshia linei TaxID=1819745 RepID=A0A177B4X1_9BILA|nr:hypothetical protein A3Q56_03535 [Intoshia linei]